MVLNRRCYGHLCCWMVLLGPLVLLVLLTLLMLFLLLVVVLLR